MDRLDRLPDKQLAAYLTRAHALVAQGLSKKKRAALGIAEGA
jgi:predicted DNA-binding protein (MmcQ/YjbR family)